MKPDEKKGHVSLKTQSKAVLQSTGTQDTRSKHDKCNGLCRELFFFLYCPVNIHALTKEEFLQEEFLRYAKEQQKHRQEGKAVVQQTRQCYSQASAGSAKWTKTKQKKEHDTRNKSMQRNKTSCS